MNEPETNCLKRFQSLLAVQIKKARGKVSEQPLEEGQKDNNDEEEEEEEDEGKGDRTRSSGNTPVLLSPFGSPLRLKTGQQSPGLWREETRGFGEAQEQNHEPEDGRARQKADQHEHQLNTWVSCSPSPRKRKARNTVTSDGECATPSPQNIFIVQASGQKQEDNPDANRRSDDSTADMIDASEPVECRLEIKEKHNLDLSVAQRERDDSCEALHPASAFDEQSSKSNAPQGEDVQTEGSSELRVSTTAMVNDLSLTKPGHADGSDTEDSPDVMQSACGATNYSRQTRLPSRAFSPETSVGLADDLRSANREAMDDGKKCVITESCIDDSSDSIFGEWQNKSKQKNEHRDRITDTDHPAYGPIKKGKSKGSAHLPDVVVEDTDNSIDMNVDWDFDCDFIDRLLTPVKSPRGEDQVSLFQEITQAQLHDMEDKMERVEIKGRLPHPPLKMTQRTHDAETQDVKDSSLLNKVQDLGPQKSTCAFHVTEDAEKAPAIHTEADCCTTSENATDGRVIGEDCDGALYPAVFQEDTDRQERRAVTQQSTDVDTDIPVNDSDVWDPAACHVDSRDCRAERKQACNSRPPTEKVISTHQKTSKSDKSASSNSFTGSPRALPSGVPVQSGAHTGHRTTAFGMSLDEACLVFSTDDTVPKKTVWSPQQETGDLMLSAVSTVVHGTEARTVDQALKSGYFENTKLPRGGLNVNRCPTEKVDSSARWTRRSGSTGGEHQQKKEEMAHCLLTLNNNSLPRPRKRSAHKKSRSASREGGKRQASENNPIEYHHAPRRPRHHSSHRRSRKSRNPTHDSSSSFPGSSIPTPRSPVYASTPLNISRTGVKVSGTSFGRQHPKDCKCLDYDCLRKRGEILHSNAMKNLNVLKQFAADCPLKRPLFNIHIKEAVGNQAREMIQRQRSLLRKSSGELSPLSRCSSSPEQKLAGKYPPFSSLSSPPRGSAETLIIHAMKQGRRSKTKHVSHKRRSSASPNVTRSLPPGSKPLYVSPGISEAWSSSIQSSKNRSVSNDGATLSPKHSRKGDHRNMKGLQNVTPHQKSSTFSDHLVTDTLNRLSTLKRSSGELRDRLSKKVREYPQTTAAGASIEEKRWEEKSNRKPVYTTLDTAAKTISKQDSAVSPLEKRPSAFFFSLEVPRPRNRQTIAMRSKVAHPPVRREVECETKHAVTKTGRNTITEELEERQLNPTSSRTSLYYYSVLQEQRAKDISSRAAITEADRVRASTKTQTLGADSVTVAVQTLPISDANELRTVTGQEARKFMNHSDVGRSMRTGVYSETSKIPQKVQHNAGYVYHHSTSRSSSTITHSTQGSFHSMAQVTTDEEVRYTIPGVKESVSRLTMGVRVGIPHARHPSFPQASIPQTMSKILGSKQFSEKIGSLSTSPLSAKSIKLHPHITNLLQKQKQRTERPHVDTRTLSARPPLYSEDVETHSTTVVNPNAAASYSSTCRGRKLQRSVSSIGEKPRSPPQVSMRPRQRIHTPIVTSYVGVSPSKDRSGRVKTCACVKDSQCDCLSGMGKRYAQAIPQASGLKKAWSPSRSVAFAAANQGRFYKCRCKPKHARVPDKAPRKRLKKKAPPVPKLVEEKEDVPDSDIIEKKPSVVLDSDMVHKTLSDLQDSYTIDNEPSEHQDFDIIEKEPIVLQESVHEFEMMDKKLSETKLSEHDIKEEPEPPPPVVADKKPEAVASLPAVSSTAASSWSSPLCRAIWRWFKNRFGSAATPEGSQEQEAARSPDKLEEDISKPAVDTSSVAPKSAVDTYDMAPTPIAMPAMSNPFSFASGLFSSGPKDPSTSLPQSQDSSLASSSRRPDTKPPGESWLDWINARGGSLAGGALMLQQFGKVLEPHRRALLTAMLLTLLVGCYFCQCCVESKDLQRVLEELMRRLSLRHLLVPPH